jgi:hypothetical protein
MRMLVALSDMAAAVGPETMILHRRSSCTHLIGITLMPLNPQCPRRRI